MAGIDWTLEEVLVIVNDYFDMLKQELSGEKYNKSAHRRAIISFLNNRTHLSIEKKHQNISAVLIENGLPYISGYKPLHNYQALLKDEVLQHLSNHPNLFNLFEELVTSKIPEPIIPDILTAEISLPEASSDIKEPKIMFNSSSTKTNYYLRELQNTRLGLLGEQFVLKFEKQKLISLGRKELTKKVEHISQTIGDSAGFDILSFDEEGKEKFIEVKTTQMGKNAPFYFSRNELTFSEINSSNYSLYRLFDFRKKPRFFQLKGTLSKCCESLPTTYMGWPK